MRIGRILIIAAAVVVVALGGAVAYVATIDVNQYKPEITAKVKEQTGRDLVIKGEINLGLFPPAATVSGVSFQNASWGSRPTMATVDSFAAQVQLMPLIFGGNIKVDRLVLKGVDVLLETDKQGRGNWEFAAKPARPTTPAPAPAAPGKPAAGAPQLPEFAEVRLDDVKLTHRDGVTGKTTTAAIKSLQASAPGGGPLKLKLEAAYNNEPVELAGTLGQLSDLAAPSRPWPIKLDIAFAGAKAAVDGAIKQPMEGKGFDLKLRAEAPDIAALAKRIGAETPLTGPLQVSARVSDPAPNRYAISELKATAGGSDLAGDITATVGGAKPVVTANLSSTKVDLAKLAPKDEKAAAGKTTAAGKSGAAKGGDGRVFNDDPLPFDALNAADADIKYRAQEILAQGTTIKNFNVALVLRNGELKVAPFSAGVGAGTLNADLTMTTRGQALAGRITGKAIPLGNLLKETKTSTYLNDGPTDFEIDFRGAGRSMRQVMAGLNGRALVQVGKGEVESKYVDLLGADAVRVLTPLEGSHAQTRLNCGVIRYDIAGGKADSKVFVIDTGRMTVVGEGNINLATEQLAMLVTPKPKDAAMVSLAVPIRVGGTLGSPSFAPDPGAAVKGVAGAVAGSVLLGPVGIIAPMLSGGQRGGDPCAEAIALATGQKPPTSAGPTQQQQPQKQQQPSGGPLQDLGKGVRGLFGR